jgi:hypothetical protein
MSNFLDTKADRGARLPIPPKVYFPLSTRNTISKKLLGVGIDAESRDLYSLIEGAIDEGYLVIPGAGYDFLSLADTPNDYAGFTNQFIKVNDTATGLEFGSAGDMNSSIYDPTGVGGDAFNMDNMVEGGTNLILKELERAYIDAVPIHIANISNPHAVTKDQVGLGNVQNVDTTNASNITTGTLPTSVIPPLAIGEVAVVASEVEQLALTAQQGDIAVRTDIQTSFIHNGGIAGDMTDWTELLFSGGGGAVDSVNGYVGVVTLDTGDLAENGNLWYTDARVNANATVVTNAAHAALLSGNPHNVTASDVGLGNVDNTSDLNKPISNATQSALDTKLESVVGGSNISVDITDPINPIISATGLVTDHGALTGLSDDDHTQYLTTARANDWLATKTTTNLTEGTNLYFTQARVSGNSDVIANVAHAATVTGNPHAVTKADVGLGNVNNTSDLNKPISTATQAALDLKLDSVVGGTGITIDNTDPNNPIINSSADLSVTLQEAFENGSAEPQLVTTTDVGYRTFVVQSGSGDDNDGVFGILNNAGSPVFSIQGTGQMAVVGDIVVTGTVDGVDLSTKATTWDAKLDSVVGGTGISIDNTDPINPIISYSGSSPTVTLQDAYDASTSPQILTSTINGALNLKRGSAADTDAVLLVTKGNGDPVAGITGAGQGIFYDLQIVDDIVISGKVDGRFVSADGTTLDNHVADTSIHIPSGGTTGQLIEKVDDTDYNVQWASPSSLGFATNLQDAYDNSSSPEIVTDATNGAVTIRRGSASDNDLILTIENGAGSPLIGGNGNGVWACTTLQASNNAQITGSITVGGTVDGRDVAADGTAQDNHIADSTIHFTEASIDHTNITNIGTNTHAQIDSHIADSSIHFSDLSGFDTDDLSEGTTNVYNKIPTGGIAGQVLEKVDGTDYNIQWTDASSGGTTTVIPYASFYQGTGGITAISNTEKILNISSTFVNSGSEYTLSSNQITVASAGDHQISFDTYINNSSTSRSEYSIYLKKNGTEVTGTRSAVYQRGYDSGMTGSINVILTLAASDYLEAAIIRTDGTATTGYQDANGTRFSIMRVDELGGAKGDTGATGATGPAGADGLLQSVVGGTDITVDSSDPANPIINYTGSGGGAEVNDLTSAVTWANVPDANITESSVTQHEGALTITESQISDLSHFTPSTLLTDYSFTDNSSNWNTAYSWGNHAGLYDTVGTASGLIGTHESTYNHSNYNTAYSWGDHSTAGYLTDITGESIKDLSDVFSSMTPSDGQALIYDTTNGWQAETLPSGVTDHTLLSNIGTNTHAQIDTHLALTNEHIDWTVDNGATNINLNNIVAVPEGVVTAHEAALTITASQITDFDTEVSNNASVVANTAKVSFPGFTSLSADYGFTDNSTNWNTAYGWGDHSTQGYLTSYTETDPIYTSSTWFNTANNSGNWNTAYSWGDHAGLYANVSHTHTASQITDFDTEVANNSAVTANTAKVTNATHTGDVTGSTSLTVNPVAISNKTNITSVDVSNDRILLWDATDSQLKRVAPRYLGDGNGMWSSTNSGDDIPNDFVVGIGNSLTFGVGGGDFVIDSNAGEIASLIPHRFDDEAQFDNDITLGGLLIDENASSGTAGQVLSATATGVEWADAASGGSLTAYKTSDEDIEKTNTLVIDSDVQVSLDASSTYSLECVIAYSADSVPDIKIGWSGPSGATMYWTDEAVEEQNARAIGTSANYPGSGLTAIKLVHIHGMVFTSTTAGTFGLTWAQNAVTSSLYARLKKGTYIKLTKLN